MSEGQNVNWYAADNPKFSLTTEGSLKIEFGIPLVGDDLPHVRLGILIAPEKVRILRQGLVQSETIQETLAAKPPTQSSH